MAVGRGCKVCWRRVGCTHSSGGNGEVRRVRYKVTGEPTLRPMQLYVRSCHDAVSLVQRCGKELVWHGLELRVWLRLRVVRFA